MFASLQVPLPSVSRKKSHGEGCVRFMVKIAVLGDRESIKGFAAVGLDIFPCDKDEDAVALFKNLVQSGYGVIYVTEHLTAPLAREIEKTDRLLTPSVVPIPGAFGNNNSGTARLKAAVERAVGSDIVFNRG